MPAFIFFYITIDYLAVLSSLAIVGGVYFFFLGFQLLAHKRLLLSIPNSRIHGAALGLIEIDGRATGPNTLPAPATGCPCFLYRTIAWHKPGDRSNWQKVADETLHLPFFVDDTTGRMLIEPLGAELDLEHEFQEEYATSLSFSSDDIPLRVKSFLARHNVASDRALRVTEYVIKPDDPLFIAGTVVENPGVELRAPRPKISQEDSSHRDEAVTAPQVISLYGGPVAANASEMTQQGKIAAALTRAGITKPEAWSAAGIPYQSVAMPQAAPPAAPDAGNRIAQRAPDPESLQNAASDSRFDLSPPVVLMRGAIDSPFVISFRSQRDMVGSLAWKSAGMVCGGAMITLLGFYTLLRQFGFFR